MIEAFGACRHRCFLPRVYSIFMKLAVIACLSFLLMAGCHSNPKPAAPKPDIIPFNMLPPEMQAKGRALYGPNVDQEWQHIVDETIKRQPWVACYCDKGKPSRPCNPTNWGCCGSAVFAPQDASLCATPNPCNCPPPPSAPAAERRDGRAATGQPPGTS